MNVNFKHVSGYILVKVQRVSKSKILGGIFREVRMSADDATIPRFRLTTEVRLSAFPATRKKNRFSEVAFRVLLKKKFMNCREDTSCCS